MLLRILSARLKLDSVRTVPTNTKEFFVRFMISREKQILTKAVGIQKEN